MAEHEPEPFEELFDAEPDRPAATDIAHWVDLYTRLVDLLERQLAETKRFGEEVAEPLRRYLHEQNERILSEELEIFRDRMAHWRSLTG